MGRSQMLHDGGRDSALKLDVTLSIHQAAQRLIELALQGGNFLSNSANPALDIALYLMA
jgi:hypothetical protein